MPDNTATFTPPETVTIPGAIALEALALLNAYADVLADFRLDGEPDPFFQLEDPVWRTLIQALGHDLQDDFNGPLPDAMHELSRRLEYEIREQFDGPALGAMAATKMAHDIAEVKARLEIVHA